MQRVIIATYSHVDKLNTTAGKRNKNTRHMEWYSTERGGVSAVAEKMSNGLILQQILR